MRPINKLMNSNIKWLRGVSLLAMTFVFVMLSPEQGLAIDSCSFRWSLPSKLSMRNTLIVSLKDSFRGDSELRCTSLGQVDRNGPFEYECHNKGIIAGFASKLDQISFGTEPYYAYHSKNDQYIFLRFIGVDRMWEGGPGSAGAHVDRKFVVEIKCLKR